MKKLLPIKPRIMAFCLLLFAFCFPPCSAQPKLIFSNDFEEWLVEPVGWMFTPFNLKISQYTPAASGNYACKVKNDYMGDHITLKSTESFQINTTKAYLVSFAAQLIQGDDVITLALVDYNNPYEINYFTHKQISHNQIWNYYEAVISVVGAPASSMGYMLAIIITGTSGSLEFIIDDIKLFETDLDYDFLEVNNIRAYIDPLVPFSSNRFEAPKNSEKSTLFASNFWMGGMDEQNVLHLAAQQFCQRGQDFFVGPITNDYEVIGGENIPSGTYLQKYDHTWKVTKEEIEYHKAHYTDDGYVIPWGIANWPAHGRTQFGESAQLAPYINVSGNSSYTPASGDYPKIRGDEAVLFMLNDALDKHTESGATNALGMEILGMAYAYNSPDSALQNTIFLSYLLKNKSLNNYKDFYFGFLSDFDIGNSTDDYVGCDSVLNLAYGYNGYSIDIGSGHGTPYGEHPPAQGTLFLNQKMNAFLYYNNDDSPIGDVKIPSDYYNMLQAKWKDGTPATYGGTGYNPGSTHYTHFIFSGDPDTETGWTELTSSGSGFDPNMPGDRRGVMSSGPFTLPAGETMCFDLALPFARDYAGDNTSSVTLLKERAKAIQQFYNNQNYGDACALTFGITENKAINDKLLVYPNPSSGKFTITCETAIANIELYDMVGRKVYADNPKVQTVQVNAQLSKGLYIYRVNLEDNSMRSGKIVVQ